MRAAVGTVDGVFLVDLEDETILPLDAETAVAAPAALELTLPRVVAAAASGSTVVAVVDRRPPLVVSHDAGVTWREAGAGLPRGRAVAIADDDPDVVLYAARNRLYLSTDGGRFWRALTVELPEIERIELD
jgi:photosystem II stability/assembly factor-like uncharacterized protein